MSKPYSTRTMRHEDWAEVAPLFVPGEFEYPDKMGYEFIKWLHAVRKLAGVPMIITDDWRSNAHNASIHGAANDSAHTDIPCDCVDIRRPKNSHERFRIVRSLLASGCKRMLEYKDTGHIHIDRTEYRRPSEIFALVERRTPR